MPSTGLYGPHSLTQEGIDAAVKGVAPGAYALGDVNANNTFIVRYVGRSDTDLNDRLKDWVGDYRQFKYAFYPTAKAAFEKECHLFHDFGETTLDNAVHPARPAGSDWKCPRCKTFG